MAQNYLQYKGKWFKVCPYCGKWKEVEAQTQKSSDITLLVVALLALAALILSAVR